MQNEDTVSEKIGQDVSPIENGDVEIYPLDIWIDGWYDYAQAAITEVIRKAVLQRHILHTVTNQSEQEVFGVRRLPNVNTETNVITRYQFTTEKRMDVVSELLLDASNNMNLARARERHEELQAPIIESNDQRRVQLEEEREENKRRLEITIRGYLFDICYQSLAKWITDEYKFDTMGFKGRTEALRPYVKLCVEVDTHKIIKEEPYEMYGNCALCFRKSVKDTRCRAESCVQRRHARIMIFTNRCGYYINPDLIHLIFADEDVPDELDTNQRRNGRSYNVCVPLERDEYLSTTYRCMFKLFWYALMYNNDESVRLKHVMNEVVTTYDASCEVVKCYSRLILNEKRSREELGFWDWRRRVTWDESIHPDLRMYDRFMRPCGITTLRAWIARGTEPVEQQERDGENTNLVREENNDVQEKNDARRGREDENDEERNVRPRRGSP